IVLSLGPTHSFPLETVFSFLSSKTVREILVQALLDSPMFGVRWRWNASRALALPRMRGGRRVPPQLQRHEAEDLLAVVFPDQLACLENIAGDREVPDHPLVEETLTDCLTEAMDVAGLERLLAAIESGEIETVGRDLTEPSPLAHEILNARPYAFLDDAPLEERRTQAVVMRRWLDPETAADLGALDQSAIDRVVADARPDATDADELHDALVTGGWLPAADADDRWVPFLASLAAAGRATVLRAADGAPELWIAAERLPEWWAAAPQAVVQPAIEAPERLAERSWEADEAVRELVRSRLDVAGPVTAASLAAECGLAAAAVERAFAALEAEGYVLRGSFTPGSEEEEWCERRLLARIHRSTLDRLRREIEPVGRADLARYLLVWQRLAPAERAEGPAAVAAVLEQLAGFAAPAAAWEGEILPGRVTDYDPAWLDALCLSGRWVWCRATPPASAGVRGAPVRTTPVAFLPRADLADWRPLVGTPALADAELSSNARVAAEALAEHGATFFADLADAAGLLHTQ
ncbi:MAG TPA: ATP-dependent DNA helicase, partial [Thermoanaerobaculia bacterium]|nr:ATP-dependent DNA helicase [Thermoanaerobaculia bacterium]